MSTYTPILYHIVFSTKRRLPCLLPEKRENLFRYIWGICKNKQCHLYRINGVEDHLHFPVCLHPAVTLSDLVKDIKVSASKWIKANGSMPDFTNWQDGYAAFTHSIKEKNVLIEYIRNQEERHRELPSREELKRLMNDAGIEYDEKYLPE